jgi:hypothetical protein
MTDDRPDIITVLEKEKEYYLEQVKRINLALSALTGDATTPDDQPKTKKTISWAAKIDEIFNNTDEWLTLEEVRQRLSEMGLTEAIEKEYRNTVYSTLHRKATQTKVLEKDEDGRYRKKGPKTKGLFDEETGSEPEKSPGRQIMRRRRPVEKKGAKESGEDPLAP